MAERKHPHAVGVGRKGEHEILVLHKSGESPESAMERVSARHPGYSFSRLDSDLDLERILGDDTHTSETDVVGQALGIAGLCRE
jgi:hypothetical protein